MKKIMLVTITLCCIFSLISCNDSVSPKNNSQNSSDDVVLIEFSDTIPFEQPFATKDTVPNETVNKTVNETVKLSDTQKKMLKLMENNPFITIIELCNQLNVSRATVTRNITELKICNLIQRIGSDKTGKWIVTNRQ